jgi:hypothetical protein
MAAKHPPVIDLDGPWEERKLEISKQLMEAASTIG